MIFFYNKLNRILLLSLIIFIAGVDFHAIMGDGPPVDTQLASQNPNLPENQSFSMQVDHLLNHLIKASKQDYDKIFNNYKEIIANEIDLGKLYFVSYREVEGLLDQAAKESINSLTLFTLPLLQNPNGPAVVFTQNLLERINRNFNFHGIFNISIPSIGDNAPVMMKFLVIGQGKFIVGYDKNAKIKHPDYDFATGRYDYRELFIMDAKRDSKGNPGLFNIKALSKSDGER